MNSDPGHTTDSPWWKVSDDHSIPSPALLVFPDRVETNIRKMLQIAGGPERLRPHTKTHKLAEVIRMQTVHGITKFKCATIAEAEMTADCGVKDLLLAYQPVGPNIGRLTALAKKYPEIEFSAVADDPEIVKSLSRAALDAGLSLKVLLDVNCGMNRTGITPGDEAVALYRLLADSPGLKPGGLHAYDGHIATTDLAERKTACDSAFKAVTDLRDSLLKAGLPVPSVVAGGTPTFPIHAQRTGVECSPGTCLFWDSGYANKLPDMDFLPAALVLTRVISKPGANRLCLDLGHKAIAAENPHPRVEFLNMPSAQSILQSEEHLVVESRNANAFAVGDSVYGIPRHICPTVALHSHAWVIRNGEAVARWEIEARNRALTV